MKRLLTIILVVGLCAGSSFGYGARGHALVGAIADRRLAKNPNTSVKAKVSELLDGMTLEEVATLPDSIKDWDPKTPDPNQPPRPPRPPFHVVGHPKIEGQLLAFVNANPTAKKPSHHDFHYTDVPVAGNEKYGDGKVGRAQSDIVHMIPYCIRVLKGQESETNKRKITKTVAVILLAHYLGDIHQPLHVGAEYFDADGKPFAPTKAKPGFADQGGNKLTLTLQIQGHEQVFKVMHSYWDGQIVTTTFGAKPNVQVADELANSEPANWRLNSPVEKWAEMLANEIMPLAREAHDRLEFKNIRIQAGSEDILSGDAVEKSTSGGMSYEQWASATVKDEIQKAGWRLPALLEEALRN
jgi:hypothetical protein